jgi:KipI family sensor histidine kinase inhibitor
VFPAHVVEYGDCGLLVTFTHEDREDRWLAGQALQSALLARTGAGIVDVIAGFDTAFISFDLLRTDHNAVRELVTSCDLSRSAPAPLARDFVLPVVYGGDRGPDLDIVADELGLSPDDVVAMHTATSWTVRLRASPAGLPMMDGPALPASVSRNPTPRVRVPPGSVGLSGQQCVVYPVASPGGWRLIGQTPIRLLDLSNQELVRYRPGDRLRFRAIAEHEWDTWTEHRLTPLEPDEGDQ